MILTSMDIWCDKCRECAGYAGAYSRTHDARDLRARAKDDGWVRLLRNAKYVDLCDGCKPDAVPPKPDKRDPKRIKVFSEEEEEPIRAWHLYPLNGMHHRSVATRLSQLHRRDMTQKIDSRTESYYALCDKRKLLDARNEYADATAAFNDARSVCKRCQRFP